MARQLRLDGQQQGVGQVVGVDVGPQPGARSRGPAHDRAEVLLDVALPLHPRRADGDRAQVRAPRRRVHQLLAEVLGQRVGVLRADRMLLVDRRVVGQERALGEEEARHGLAGDVHEARHAEAHRRLERVEGRHDVVLEDRVRGVARRLGERGGVHHRVVATHERERVARIGDVGLHVVGVAGPGRLEGGRQAVGRRDLMPGPQQGGDGGGPDLAAGSGDEDAHGRVPADALSPAAGRSRGRAWRPRAPRCARP